VEEVSHFNDRTKPWMVSVEVWRPFDTVPVGLESRKADSTDHQAPQSTLVHITAAMTAGATGTIMTNPLWVVKTRFMVCPPSNHLSPQSLVHPYIKIISPDQSHRLESTSLRSS
jgi:hypothetical protein